VDAVAPSLPVLLGRVLPDRDSVVDALVIQQALGRQR
jgi:hypothetical protein